MRIASLLPSATEIVYALGLDDQLVAVTFECNEPPRARREKRIIVGGRDTSDLTPGEIDAYVREQFAAGADLYTLHADAMAELRPDLILTQDLCRVCAVPTGKVREAVEHLGCTADVVTLDPYSLDDVLASITTVARATGVQSRGVGLVGELTTRLEVVARAVHGRGRPRTAIIEWVDPPFGAGHWMPDMIAAAGGRPVAAHPQQRSAPTTWDDVRAAEPEIVVVAPCGFGLDGAIAQASVVAAELPEADVWAIDADGLVVRPGPRLVEGVEALAAVLHPGLAEAGTIPDRRAAVRLVQRRSAPAEPVSR